MYAKLLMRIETIHNTLCTASFFEFFLRSCRTFIWNLRCRNDGLVLGCVLIAGKATPAMAKRISVASDKDEEEGCSWRE